MPIPITELWTTTQAAEYCKCSAASYRRYISRLRAPGPVSPANQAAPGEPLHDAAAVRAWADERTGRGSRTDLHRSAAHEIAQQAIADRNRYGYPDARNRDTASYETPDGIKITFRWQQDIRQLDSPNARMDWVYADWGVAHYGVAAAEFSYISLVDDLTRIIREARKARGHARALREDADRQHKTAVQALRAAADRVDAEYAVEGRYGYPAACEMRRHLIREAVAEQRLTAQEIADAARVDVRDLP